MLFNFLKRLQPQTKAVKLPHDKYDLEARLNRSGIKGKAVNAATLTTTLSVIAIVSLAALPAAAFTPPPGRGIPPVTSGGSSR
jgi:hypothetical protein